MMSTQVLFVGHYQGNDSEMPLPHLCKETEETIVSLWTSAITQHKMELKHRRVQSLSHRGCRCSPPALFLQAGCGEGFAEGSDSPFSDCALSRYWSRSPAGGRSRRIERRPERCCSPVKTHKTQSQPPMWTSNVAQHHTNSHAQHFITFLTCNTFRNLSVMCKRRYDASSTSLLLWRQTTSSTTVNVLAYVFYDTPTHIWHIYMIY